ncbi:MAG: flagellar hook capping FlgD N-terminal domain-containing protein [Acidobacteriota bacterium]
MTINGTDAVGRASGGAAQADVGVPPRTDQLGRDAFLTLLITQLQHQDPTSPMADAEFITQLATFSQLEKLTQMSDSLKAIETVLTSLPIEPAPTSTGTPSQIHGGK